jgi:hypothetical protein
MVSASGPITAEEIRELTRVSSAQLDAAKAGNFEEVRLLLGTRQRLLEGLRGRASRPGDLELVVAADSETFGVLRAEIGRVDEVLTRLDTGGRALSGYAMKAAAAPAFLDHVR